MHDIKFDSIADAIDDLKNGKVIIICDDEKRENEGDFVTLADNITPEIVNFMITHGKGLLCTPIDTTTAKQLNLHMMVDQNTDNLSTAFTVSVDHKTNTTGISVFDRCVTIKELTNCTAQITDFRRPGHIFPLIARQNGVLERAGHTEATIDLAKLCGASKVGVICEIVNPDGQMARRDDLLKLAKKFNLKIITIKDLVTYRKRYDKLVSLEAKADLPTKFGKFTIYGYVNLLNNEHISVIVKGEPNQFNNPFVRIHSECLTGDVFHSLRCDCGEQLDISLKTIEQEGQGIVIYLKQEGRGIGLINKLKAYELQQNGLDTFDANVKLGFGADMREYFIAAQVLRDLGMANIRLATNNPQKVEEMIKYGITVTKRIPIQPTPHKYNQDYLNTKTEKFGHLL